MTNRRGSLGIGIALIIVGLVFAGLGGYTLYANAQGGGSISIQAIAQGGGFVQGALYVDSQQVGISQVKVPATAGTHTISFGPVASYTTPSPVTVTVINGQTAQAVGIYIPTGGGYVPPTMSVSSDRSAMEPGQTATITASVTRDGNPVPQVTVSWNAGNQVYAQLSVSSSQTDPQGVATVSLTQTVAPSSAFQITVTASATSNGTSLAGSVQIWLGGVPPATLTIKTTWVSGQQPPPYIYPRVYVDGNDVGSSQGTITVQVQGVTSHHISWASTPNYDTPADQTIYTDAGQSYTVTGTYYGHNNPNPPSKINFYVSTISQLPSGGLPDPVANVVVDFYDGTGAQIATLTTDASGQGSTKLNVNIGAIVVTAYPPSGSGFQVESDNTFTVGTSDLSKTFRWTEHGFSLLGLDLFGFGLTGFAALLVAIIMLASGIGLFIGGIVEVTRR